jgi:hypothetical protein
LGAEDQEVAKFLWQPNDGNKVVTVNTDSRINVWDFSSEGRVQVLSFTYLVQFKSKSNFECLE